MQPINIIDPRTLIPSPSPWIVLSNANDTIGDIIDFRTDIKGIHPASHAMVSVHQGKFPMENYLSNKNGWLAFVQVFGSNPIFCNKFTSAVEARLALPWWERFYNFVEIAGQAIGDPSFSFPGLYDCSMIDVSLLQNTDGSLPLLSQNIISAMSKYQNPEQLWQTICNNSDVFEIYGFWSPSNGGIVV
jgi:hypothetical protein